MRQNTVEQAPIGSGSTDEAAADSSSPHVISVNGVYSVAGAGRALGLPKTCLPREIRGGRLRCSKRAGRYFILGKWLLEWLESGERRRDPAKRAGVAEASV